MRVRLAALAGDLCVRLRPSSASERRADTRSPRAIRSRSIAPETCRQFRAPRLVSLEIARPVRAIAEPALTDRARFSPEQLAGGGRDRGDAYASACDVRAEHDQCALVPPFPRSGTDTRRTRLAGASHASIKSQQTSRPATSDTTKGTQGPPADSRKESQLAARSGPSPSVGHLADARILACSPWWRCQSLIVLRDGGGAGVAGVFSVREASEDRPLIEVRRFG